MNFWRPGGDREFRVLAPGEPFFFKTHYPHNRVVGGGFYSGFAPLRLSEAWELFERGNGVDSLDGMRRLVGRYRQRPIAPSEDPTIGCIFIRDTTFFRADDPAAPPPGMASNVVQGKGYDLADPEVSGYFADLLTRLLEAGPGIDPESGEPWHRPGAVYGDPRLTPQRLGQQAFQAVVLRAYSRRCAINGIQSGVQQPATGSGRCCRPRTSGRCRPAATTAWTTGCRGRPDVPPPETGVRTPRGRRGCAFPAPSTRR